MSLKRYQGFATATYLAVFTMVFAILGDAPAYPLMGSVFATVAGAVVMGVFGTLNLLKISKNDEPPFQFVTVSHGIVMACMLAGAVLI